LITVVVVNYNRCNDLREALQSVRNQYYQDIEIIVVDNASRDDSIDMLKEEFPDVSVIALKENIGMDGYSVGFEKAAGEFIFQMDNDSLMPDKNVLGEVVRRFNEGPEDLAVVATRVEEFNSEKDEIETLRLKDKRIGPLNTGGFHSGGVGFRKKYLDQVGYYNRDIFLYGSELFLQMKFLAAKYKVYYYPEILMLHKSSKVARSSGGLFYEFRNRYWFMRKFATPGQKIRYFPYILVHDFLYSFYKKSPYVYLRALREGFGAMPPSLSEYACSSNPDYRNKVDEVGKNYGITAFIQRLKRNKFQ
jgi:GT2 family glycosyltransferase